MAGIDKIYLPPRDVPRFYEFLRSIDNDYRATFPNSPSILDYTYLGTYTPEEIEEYARDLEHNPDVTEVPVSNFPEIVDKFLYQHPRTPEFIKKYLLEHQYHDEADLLEPLSPANPYEYSGRFRIVSKRPREGKMFRNAVTYWEGDMRGPDGDFLRYYHDLGVFVPDDCAGPEYFGLEYSWSLPECTFKSLRALFRFIRKTKLPVGSRIRVRDFRYKISELELLIIPEKA